MDLTNLSPAKEINPKNDMLIKIKKILSKPFFSILLISITVIGILGFFFVFIPIKQIASQAKIAQAEAKVLKQAANDKDLVKAKESISKLRIYTKNIESTYKRLGYMSIIPIANNYYKDGKRVISIIKDGLDTGDIVIQAIEPYKDFIGAKGTSTSGEQTTEDRIAFLTQSIEGLIPHLGTIDNKITNIETSLNQINAKRYPEEFKGFKLRSSILSAQETVDQTHTLIKNGQPILSKISWLLGKDKPRQYLMIFQNDAELRPTGGFWTAYGIIKVDNGKVTSTVSDDIYALDAKLNSRIPAPRPIKAYHINVPYYNLRDMNISPDFPTSTTLFLENYNKVVKSKDKIDAVIGIDTQVLVDFVKVLGKVGVSGFGNFSSEPDQRCNGCPQIIYELEMLADKPKSFIDTNRKGFLGPLMNSLLLNAMGSEKSKIGPLTQLMFTDIQQKHILFYFLDPEVQKAAELANIAGSIVQTDKNTDYFNVTESNMASAKSNLFITEKIKHEITTKNGKVSHKITITYNNPEAASNCNLEKGDLCLNAAKYRDWFRFYVPTGSKMIKMTGSEVETVQYEELGKQVFEGFFGNKYPLYAKSTLKTSIQYESSVPATKNYVLYLQKQAGTKAFEYELSVNGQKQETFSWTGDKTIKLAL
ncbi:MAG: DUF4012 domain-containing protein [Candidatus Shapirobacteria bacterium]